MIKNIGRRFLTVALLCGCLGGAHQAKGQPAIPIQWYPLDSGDGFLTAYDGAPVIATSNLVSVPMSLGTGWWPPAAVILDNSNTSPVILAYNVVESNGIQNLNYSPGSILFYLLPNFQSASLPGGSGPGQTASLISGGDWSPGSPNGLFRIYINAAASSVCFGGVSNGVSVNYVTAPIAWASNTWHEIGVEWGAAGRHQSSAIYLDGMLAATGSMPSIVPQLGLDPTESYYTNIFYVGSDSQGLEQCRAAMAGLTVWGSRYGAYYTNDWVETSNALAAWQSGLGGGSGFGAMISAGMRMSLQAGPLDGGADFTNYNDCSNFWLGASTGIPDSPSNVVFTLQNAKSELTYAVLTNSVLDGDISHWSVWTTATASNSVIVLPGVDVGSNALFLSAQLVLCTTTNGLPDFWQLKYFGNLLEPTNGCFDGDGVPDLQKYLTGADPNVIAFDIAFMNQFVNLTNVPLSLGILGGVPYNYAVLVDNTNFGGASWMPYTSSNITAYLGTNEGWHTVWVGLRGLPADAQQTWNSVTLDLDLTRPTLVITSPAAGSTVDMPVIQVQGFCPERLSSIIYDLSNAAGLVTNQQVLVVDQYYDMSIWAFTTNFFQAFDVPLTNGLNTFTFHGADLAGNVMVTNFSVMVDYSGKTNPPSVQVTWPTNGMILCGMNFFCCGLVSDPTATVAVQIADSFGDTNSITAAVGRNGDFYAANLPLTNGANYLTVTATDVVGNTTTNSLTITQGESGLTIDAVAPGQTTVTGTIGPGDYTVWVNGVEATSNGDGTWTAQITPIGIGGGTVVAMAVSSSGRQDFAAALDEAPSGVYISSYQASDHEDYYRDTNYWTVTNQIAWTNGQGGSETLLWHPDMIYPQLELYSWPATSWPQTPANGTWIEINAGNNGTTDTNNPVPPPLVQEHCNVSFAYPYQWATNLQRTADAKVSLATGGPSGSTKMNLWLISCSATNYAPPWNVYYGCVWYNSMTGTPINPRNISIPSGQFDTNGNLYVVLPDNTNLDVTPVITGPTSGYYTFNITATNIAPQILFNGTNVAGSNVTVIVGQQVNLILTNSVGTTLPNIAWSVPGYAISGYDVTNAIVFPYFQTNTSLLSIYWVDAGTKRVSCTAQITGLLLSNIVTFTVLSPTLSIYTNLACSFVANDYPLFRVQLNLGDTTPNHIGQMDYTLAIDAPCRGYLGIQQVCWLNYSSMTHQVTNELDNVVWYSGPQYVKPGGLAANTNNINLVLLNLSDSPGAAGSSPLSLQGAFTDFVLFQPYQSGLGNSIYVPIGIVDWDFFGIASYGWPTATITTNVIAGPFLTNGFTGFPSFTNVFKNQD